MTTDLAPGTPVITHGKHIALAVGTADRDGVEWVSVRPATFDDSRAGALIVHPSMVVRLDGPATFAHGHLLAAAARRAGLSGMRVRL